MSVLSSSLIPEYSTSWQCPEMYTCTKITFSSNMSSTRQLGSLRSTWLSDWRQVMFSTVRFSPRSGCSSSSLPDLLFNGGSALVLAWRGMAVKHNLSSHSWHNRQTGSATKEMWIRTKSEKSSQIDLIMSWRKTRATARAHPRHHVRSCLPRGCKAAEEYLWTLYWNFLKPPRSLFLLEMS